MDKTRPYRLTPDQQVWLATAAFFCICSTLQWWRMQSLTASMDQGILYQVLWNALQGHPFESTLSSQLSTNVVHSGGVPSVGYHRLGQHFTPTLLIWLPLIALMGKWALPILQVFLVSSAGLVLYNLAKSKLSSNLASIITFSFFGANAVIGPCLGNFTDLCQLPICVFGLLLGIEKRINWLIIFTILFIPLIREDTGIVLMGIGIWLACSKRLDLRMAIAMILYGGGWVIISTNLIMPLFSEDNSKRFMVENFGQYIQGKEQASSIEVIKLLFQQPLVVIRELVSPPGKTIRYLAGQGLPLAFIPFISSDSILLIGLPLLGLLLAQGNPLAINWRYTYLVIPGLFSGSIYWWEKNSHLFASRRFRKFWLGCIGLSLIFTLTSNPNRTLSWMMPQSIEPWVYRSPINQWNHSQSALNAINIIPKDSSISASNTLIPHLASREVLIRFPYNTSYQNRQKEIQNVEWIAVDLDEHQRYAEVFRNEWEDLQEIINVINQVNKEYAVVYAKNGIILLNLNGHEKIDTANSLKNMLLKALSIPKPQ